MKNLVLEEYKKARKEGRQPICPYCHKVLQITQTQYKYINWVWDQNKRAYIKDETDGEEEKPSCIKCWAQDWNFFDDGMVSS